MFIPIAGKTPWQEVADYAKILEEQVIAQQLVIEQMREALLFNYGGEPCPSLEAAALKLQPSLDLLEADRQRVRGECAKAME